MNNATLTNSILSITHDGKLSLEHVISMLSTQYDKQTVLELVRNLCLQSNKDEIMKKGMEFLYMNGFYKDLQFLIDKNNKSENKSNNQWAIIYQLMIDRKLNHITPQEIVHHSAKLHIDEPELLCLREFLINMSHYDMREFGRIGNFIEKQQHLFETISDPFLISFFNIRMYEALFVYYWVRNELIMARKYAFRVLNLTQNPRTKAAVNINLALTYTFDTYQQGIHHLNEARTISKEYGLLSNINAIKNQNIPFISAYHKRVAGVTTNDKSEQAHIEIAKGNHKKAESILRNLPIDTPFQMYYMGLATNDKNLLYQSYNYFIEKRSDHFFSKLPILALQELDAGAR